MRPDGEHEPILIRIPDSGALIRSGALPKELLDPAVLFTSHPEGTDEMMRELVITAAIGGLGEEPAMRMVRAGNDLRPHLIAAMVVEPEITPDEVAEGLLPELDVRMLLEFAERQRNVDAAGNQLPIALLRDYGTFRSEPAGGAGTGAGGANGASADGDVPHADEDAV